MPLSVAVDDVLEMVLIGFYDNTVQINNVFHYKVTAQSAATLNEFAAGLFATVVANIQNTVATIINFDNITAKILDADGHLVNAEAYIIPSGSGAGSNAGDSLPPENCITFKYLRPDATFRHGFKRFAGVPEAGQVNGLVTSTYLTGLTTLAGVLETPVHAYTIDGSGLPDTVMSGDVMTPVIIQRVVDGDVISPVNIGTITDVVFDKLGTQNTRKFGRGV